MPTYSVIMEYREADETRAENYKRKTYTVVAPNIYAAEDAGVTAVQAEGLKPGRCVCRTWLSDDNGPTNGN